MLHFSHVTFLILFSLFMEFRHNRLLLTVYLQNYSSGKNAKLIWFFKGMDANLEF